VPFLFGKELLMKKFIALIVLTIITTMAIPFSASALSVDGTAYNQSMWCAIVTGGFGKIKTVSLANDNGQTANLLGTSGSAIASYGYWYNSGIGIDRSKAVGAGAYVNGGYSATVLKSTWQWNNLNTGVGYQGTTSSVYRGLSYNINQDLSSDNWKPGYNNLVWSFFLQTNSVDGSINGLDDADKSGARIKITGTGLPNSTSYGSSETYSNSGTTSVSNYDARYGNYYISVYIPNASKYNVTYTVSYRRGSKYADQYNTTSSSTYQGSGSFSTSNYYVESGGYISVSVNANKKGTVVADLYLGSGVSSGYAGKTFNIYNSSGSFIKSATTDGSGYAYFYDMGYGTYTLRPSGAPSGYYYDPTSCWVTLNSSSVYGKFTLYRNTGDLSINYSTEDGLSRSNVQFKVTNPSGGVSYYYTDSYGNIFLSNLTTGSYKIEQTSSPTDYERVTAVQTVNVYAASTSNVNFYNPILYKLSVDITAPSSAVQMDYFNITVNYRNNGGKAANNVPVTVSFDGSMISVANTIINIPANGTVSKIYAVRSSNVGTKTISATVNSGNVLHENSYSDDTATRTISITTATNLQIEYVNTTGEYREGTEVISTFRVKNFGYSNMLPSNNLKVSLTVTYPGGSVNVPQKTEVVIPANGDNIVYFRWTVPSGTAGKVFTLSAKVNADNAVNEINTGDNMVTVTKTIVVVNSSTTPDTRFEKSSPSDFSRVNAPVNSGYGSVSWSEWVYESNAFVKKTYGLSLSTGSLSIVPDINAPSRKYTGGYWYMGSGYGFTTIWTVSTSTLTGTTAPLSTAYTGAQVANIFLPEYKYTTAINKYRSLVLTGTNSFQLPTNPYAKNNARLHFVPIWFPDGNYIAQGFVSDIWTPAGMMTGYVNSNTLIISQSAYDDWYIGR
jgi:hypothetical protein